MSKKYYKKYDLSPENERKIPGAIFGRAAVAAENAFDKYIDKSKRKK